MALTTLPPVWIMSFNRLFFFGGYPLYNDYTDVHKCTHYHDHIQWLRRVGLEDTEEEEGGCGGGVGWKAEQ